MFLSKNPSIVHKNIYYCKLQLKFKTNQKAIWRYDDRKFVKKVSTMK